MHFYKEYLTMAFYEPLHTTSSIIISLIYFIWIPICFVTWRIIDKKTTRLEKMQSFLLSITPFVNLFRGAFGLLYFAHSLYVLAMKSGKFDNFANWLNHRS